VTHSAQCKFNSRSRLFAGVHQSKTFATDEEPSCCHPESLAPVDPKTIESVWSMLKRQIVGTHHWVGEKHLDQYVSEMTWRMNCREMSLQDRINALFSAVEERLTYKELIA
jgi:hypothetical protein